MSNRYQINGTTVIDENRKGYFQKLNPGVYTSSEREALSSLSEGEIVYDSTEKKLYVYDGSAWAGIGGGENALQSDLPPFGGYAETETYLHSDDGKVTFSLDDNTYSSTLTVPRNTFYYVGWGTDIRYASHGGSYSASIGATFTSIGTTRTIEYEIPNVDKVPDLSVGFTSMSELVAGDEYESNIISCFETINAPAQIWVTSDAPSYKLRIGVGTWFDPPSIPSTTYINQNEEIQVKHTTNSTSLDTTTTTVNVGYGTGAGEFDSSDFFTVNSASWTEMRVLIQIKGGAGKSASANGGAAGGGEGGEGEFALEYNYPAPNGASDMTGSLTYYVGQSNNSSGESTGWGNGGSNNNWNASGGGSSAIKLNSTVIAVCGGGGGGGGGYVNQGYAMGAGGAGLSASSASVDGSGGTSTASSNNKTTGAGGAGGLGQDAGDSAYAGLTQNGKTSAGGAGGGGGNGGGGRGGYVTSINEYPDNSDSDRGWGGGGGGGGIYGLAGTTIGDYTITNISGSNGRGGFKNSTQNPGYIKLLLQTKSSDDDDNSWVAVGSTSIYGNTDAYATGTVTISSI